MYADTDVSFFDHMWCLWSGKADFFVSSFQDLDGFPLTYPCCFCNKKKVRVSKEKLTRNLKVHHNGIYGKLICAACSGHQMIILAGFKVPDSAEAADKSKAVATQPVLMTSFANPDCIFKN